jgi:hypothetical protein
MQPAAIYPTFIQHVISLDGIQAFPDPGQLLVFAAILKTLAVLGKALSKCWLPSLASG